MPAMIPASDSLRIADTSFAVTTDFSAVGTFEFTSAAPVVVRVELVLMGLWSAADAV